MCFLDKKVKPQQQQNKKSNIKTLTRAFAARHFQQIHFSVIFLNA